MRSSPPPRSASSTFNSARRISASGRRPTTLDKEIAQFWALRGSRNVTSAAAALADVVVRAGFGAAAPPGANVNRSTRLGMREVTSGTMESVRRRSASGVSGFLHN